MRIRRKHILLLLPATLASTALLAWLVVVAPRAVMGAAAMGLCMSIFAVRRLVQQYRAGRGKELGGGQTPKHGGREEQAKEARVAASVAAAADPDSLVGQMINNGRFALLLRSQIVGNLTPEELQAVVELLDESMSLVPTGPVVIRPPQINEEQDELSEEADGNSVAGRLVMVDSMYLDRWPVTNGEFKHFVDEGGYEQMAIWDEEALPALFDFVDRTGQPGPRPWIDGCCPSGQDSMPVVGVSWYEASAFARWCGKRLPTDAEWVKAGAWPVEASPGNFVQRRYPWGNAFDPRRANIWGSGPDGIVPVDEFEEGSSIGGAYQLIGNVWEWTNSRFGAAEDMTLRLPAPMKSLRGGAFDTYFDNQATCQFQSGDSPLSRRHNIGFRLALGVCDLAPEACSFLAQMPIPDDAQLEQAEAV